MKKNLILFIILISLFGFAAFASADVTTPNLWKFVSGAIQPVVNTWTIGSASNRVSKVWVSDIDASGATINGVRFTGGGTGDVVGPTGATNSNFAAFNTATGKLIKDSGYNPTSFLLRSASTSLAYVKSEVDPIFWRASTSLNYIKAETDPIFWHASNSLAYLSSGTKLEPMWRSASTSLAVSNFSSSNISQWTNNANYLPNNGVFHGTWGSLTTTTLPYLSNSISYLLKSASTSIPGYQSTSLAKNKIWMGNSSGVATQYASNSLPYLSNTTTYLANNSGDWGGTWQNYSPTGLPYLSSATSYLSPTGNFHGTWSGKASTSFVYTSDSRLTDARAPLAHNQDWSTITTGRPTTLSGYGITDALSTSLTKGSFQVGNNSGLASATSTIFSDGANIGIGTTLPTANLHVLSAGQNIINAISNINNWAQIQVQNTNAGASSSADVVATANNGNTTKYFVNMGINSSGFNTSRQNIWGADDAYLYSSDKNLTIGTASSSGSLLFHTGGLLSSNVRMKIDSSGNVGIGTISPSQQLEITKNFQMPNTTHANQYGIIYKNGNRFLHDFNYGDNGTVTTAGGNLFLGEN
ncbi:MAG: hypothetical protein PHO56_02230, partial [Patescibacteria group bacterium]|nr:hypothetical protein [Patescibacteria group bacterium]